MVVGHNIEDPEQGKRGDLTYNLYIQEQRADPERQSEGGRNDSGKSAAYPPGDGALTYGQRQGDLRHNSVDRRR